MLGLTCRVIEAVPGHGEIYFAVGSAAFCWLLLRGRMIPVALAWLGVIASALLVMLLPLQIAGFFGGPRAWSSPVTWAVWLPLFYFVTVCIPALLPIPVLVPIVVMLYWLWRVRIRKTFPGIVGVGTPQVSGATK